MKSSLNITLTLLLLTFTTFPCVFSQSLSGPTKEISGEIVFVDPVSSTFSVQEVTDEARDLAQNIIITVDKTSVLKKGDAALTFSDLKIGDKVSVSYTSTLDDTNIAQAILVK